MPTTTAKLQPTLQRIRRAIIAATLGLGLVAVVGLVAIPIEEKVPATGLVQAEHAHYVYAGEDGLVREIVTRDGAVVAAGDVLFQLEADDLEDRRRQLEAEQKESRAALELKRAQVERVTVLPLPKEFWHARTELTETEQRARHAEAERRRYQELLDGNLVSQVEYESRRLAAELAQTAVAKAREQLAVVEKGLEKVVLKEALAEVDVAAARVARLQTDLEICAAQLARRAIRAPVAGTVTWLAKRRPGERVVKGEELARLAQGPATRARLFVGESQIHRLAPGQPVRLRSKTFDPLRYGYIEGVVETVSLEPYQPDNGHAAAGYLVCARMEQTPVPLALGSGLEGHVILRRVPLWRLLWPAK